MSDEPAYFRVTNWERYQVFHDGRPMRFFAIHVKSDPAKDRVGIFDDPTFLQLANEPDCPVFRVMAYAAVTGNRIPNNEEFLKARLFAPQVNLKKMADAGLLEPVYESVRDRTKPYLEAEAEVEPEVEKSKSKSSSALEALEALIAAIKSPEPEETENVIRFFHAKFPLPEAAYRTAREDLLERRAKQPALIHEGKYVHKILKRYVEENQYGRSAA